MYPLDDVHKFEYAGGAFAGGIDERALRVLNDVELDTPAQIERRGQILVDQIRGQRREVFFVVGLMHSPFLQ